MESKKLYRPKKDRVIAGVCSGLSQYFKVDVVIVRLIFVLMAVYAGSGVLIYIILWIVMPEENGDSYAENIKKNINENDKSKIKQEIKTAAQEIKKTAVRNSKSAETFAFLLIFCGIIFLMQNFLPAIFNFAKLWPLVFVALGIALLASSNKE